MIMAAVGWIGNTCRQRAREPYIDQSRHDRLFSQLLSGHVPSAANGLDILTRPFTLDVLTGKVQQMIYADAVDQGA